MLRPDPALVSLTLIPLAAAVSVHEALASLGVAARLKWPNDIVTDSGKLAGLLLEVEGEAEGPLTVVVGIGVNVSVRPGLPPGEVAALPPASLADSGRLPSRSRLLPCARTPSASWSRPRSPMTVGAMSRRLTSASCRRDRRTPGRNEDVLLKVSELEGVRLVKGKVGKIEQNGGNLTLKVEDVENETILEAEHDLVVLATGMVPNAVDEDLAIFTRKDDDGFVLDDIDARVTVAGVARRPEDVAASVRDATGAAARALVTAGRRS